MTSGTGSATPSMDRCPNSLRPCGLRCGPLTRGRAGSPSRPRSPGPCPTSTTSAGDLDRLALWHDLGEQALLVAPPGSGRPHRPAGRLAAGPGRRGGRRRVRVRPRARRAAGADHLHLRRRPRAAAWTSGTRVDWTAYDGGAGAAAPRRGAGRLPARAAPARRDPGRHREPRRRRRAAVRTRRRPASWPTRPWAAAGACRAGLPGRAARVIALAATVSSIVDVALSLPDGALSAARQPRATPTCGGSSALPSAALAEATNAACGRASPGGARPER